MMPSTKSVLLKTRRRGTVRTRGEKSEMSLRRKLPPNLIVCAPRVIERSSTNWYWVTLRPCGNTLLMPPMFAHEEVSKSYKAPGKVAWAAVDSVPKMALYQLPERMNWLNMEGLITRV